MADGSPDDPAGLRRPHPAWLDAFLPKTLVCLREGYGRSAFLQDLLAGITVGIIAIPLAMAFAINSGVTPDRGLYTAIVAGFLIAVLGGSRVSVAGPTGAFVPILYAIVAKHGYDGLAIATLMAGGILVIMGLARFGGMIKFIPYPVTTGFTTGIAVIIFSQQMKDFFGLSGATMAKVPPDFLEKWHAYYAAVRDAGVNWTATAIAGGGMAVILLFRRFAPRVPGAIVAVVLAAVAVAVFRLDQPGPGGQPAVETIGTRFGGIPQSLPLPHWITFRFFDGSDTPPPVEPVAHPADGGDTTIVFSLQRARELIPEATTIALLAAIESLLCCVVADGMIGGRHKSNAELVAQGLGNMASIFFGGIPATGAIARTAANVKSGGRTPVAAIVHAFTVLACMLALAPYASKIPLAVLASVLVVVAWNMSELDHFRTLMRSPKSDIAVLLTTFGLTVLADLTVAVGVGLVLAALLFMRRMSEVTNVGAITAELADDQYDVLERGDPNAIERRHIPRDTEVYEISGPFFFGVADRLKDTLRELERPPRVFILRMRRVPAIDATGMHALDEFVQKCQRQHTVLLLSGVHAQPLTALVRYGLFDRVGEENVFGNIDDALNRARKIVGEAPEPPPPDAIPEVLRESRTFTGLPPDGK